MDLHERLTAGRPTPRTLEPYADLKNAIQAFGRAGDKAAAKSHPLREIRISRPFI